MDGRTDREHEVLRLVAVGYTNREIADHSAISENTVEFRMRRVLDELRPRARRFLTQGDQNYTTG